MERKASLVHQFRFELCGLRTRICKTIALRASGHAVTVRYEIT
ncbi:MAG: hypothetical protein H6Q97_790, partial [Nitrospirae bacterium]|nr:hypothetical protein [Nitrospirota bacterium]